jgi:hypothetical protein
MKPAVALILGIASVCTISAAHGEIYQWKDAAGHTVVSDTPPSGRAGKEARVIGSRQAVSKGEAAEKPAEAAKSTAEKDLDFKKRQQEARDKADKEAKDKKAEADRQENCERARRNLAAMEAGQGVTTFDEKGQRNLLNEEQRQQEMNRYREFVAQSCK